MSYTFDPNEVPKDEGGFDGERLPVGDYTVASCNATLKETSAKDGFYIELEFDIMAPAQFVSRKHWETFNIVNKSEKAVQIANGKLKDFCDASHAGRFSITQLQDGVTIPELMGKTCNVRLGLEKKPRPGYEARCEVKRYSPAGAVSRPNTAAAPAAGAPAAGAPASAPQATGGDQAAAPAAGGKMPWEQ